jgi:WhiB family redox-sensing transcriptional regulator
MQVKGSGVPEPSLALDWQAHGACTQDGVDPELFFPVGTTGPALVQVEQARAVCRGCPVAGQCLSWALDAGERHGVWGGLFEDELAAVRRVRAQRVRTEAARVEAALAVEAELSAVAPDGDSLAGVAASARPVDAGAGVAA